METIETVATISTALEDSSSMDQKYAIGDVLDFNEYDFRKRETELQRTAGFVNSFIERYSETKIKGSILTFIQNALSSEGWFKYLDQAAEIAKAECKKLEVELPALLEVVTKSSQEKVQDLIKEIQAASKQEKNLRLGAVKMVDGKAIVKEEVLEDLRKEFEVRINSEKQLEFWNNWMVAKNALDAMVELLAQQTTPRENPQVTLPQLLNFNPNDGRVSISLGAIRRLP